jgi:adenylate cyclase
VGSLNPPVNLQGKPLLRWLLSRRNQFPHEINQIDERITQEFARNVAVLVLDMVGFSRLTIKYGIIHYLAMIEQMDDAARPAIIGNNGRVIKQEADNIFAIFNNPVDAIEAALDIFRAFEAVNTVVPPERDIYGCIGIGYGSTLVIDDNDMFGSEMNLASKLGEDLAESMEILLTQSAFEALTSKKYVCNSVMYQLHDMELQCYRLDRSLHREE